MRLLAVLTSAAALTWGGAALAQQALLPDLIINREDSFVAKGGCEVGDLLAEGRIAVKNIGEAEATGGSAAANLQLNWLAAYNPYNPDLTTGRLGLGIQNLQPLDQRGIRFELGADRLKRGRRFARPRYSDFGGYELAEDISRRDEIRAIQAALRDLGYDPGGIDGAYGAGTKQAVEKYQADFDFPVTGELTEDEKGRLFRESGTSLFDEFGAQGEVEVEVFVYVDPENEIRESNESNNIEVWTIRIDCTP